MQGKGIYFHLLMEKQQGHAGEQLECGVEDAVGASLENTIVHNLI